MEGGKGGKRGRGQEEGRQGRRKRRGRETEDRGKKGGRGGGGGMGAGRGKRRTGERREGGGQEEVAARRVGKKGGRKKSGEVRRRVMLDYIYFITSYTLGATQFKLCTVATKHPTSLANSISDQSTSVDSLSMNVGKVANPVTKPGIGEYRVKRFVTWWSSVVRHR